MNKKKAFLLVTLVVLFPLFGAVCHLFYFVFALPASKIEDLPAILQILISFSYVYGMLTTPIILGLLLLFLLKKFIILHKVWYFTMFISYAIYWIIAWTTPISSFYGWANHLMFAVSLLSQDPFLFFVDWWFVKLKKRRNLGDRWALQEDRAAKRDPSANHILKFRKEMVLSYRFSEKLGINS